MSIVVFGANGMLGRYVVKYLNDHNYNVYGLTRKNFDISKQINELEDLLTKYRPVFVVNCAGIINKREDEISISEMYTVNAYFPVLLSFLCVKYNVGMIQPTTDCIYSGKQGGYTKRDKPDAETHYGKSKYLGEQLFFSPKICVLRTSIIGEETNGRSLISWVKSNRGKTIDGYTNHFWNGITCLEYAKIILQAIRDRNWSGLRVIGCEYPVTKCELVKLISNAYELNVTVKSTNANYCDRILVPDIDTKSIEEQISEMVKYELFEKNISHSK